MHRTGLLATLGIFLVATALPSAAKDRLRQLDASQIKTFVVGKAITDGAHWSDHFYRDGSMKPIELGQTKRGTWILQDKTLCITRPLKKGKTETDCNEIWKSGDRIEYRRDGVTAYWLTTQNTSNSTWLAAVFSVPAR